LFIFKPHETSLTSQNMSIQPKYLLTITSHGRTFGPLTPVPDALINLTSLPNPPVQLRKNYVGTNARLRKEFFGYERVRAALEGSLAKVKGAMEEIERKRRSSVSGEEVDEGSKDVVMEMSDLSAKDDRVALKIAGDESGSHEWSAQSEDEDEEENEADDKSDSLQDTSDGEIPHEHILTVGVQCEMGRHRSVAFAEELGRSIDAEGREGWLVEVRHRDLGNKRGGRAGGGAGKEPRGRWTRKRGKAEVGVESDVGVDNVLRENTP
jgi:hypothetical protein